MEGTPKSSPPWHATPKRRGCAVPCPSNTRTSGLRSSLAAASGVASSAGVVEPEKSRIEKFFAKTFRG